MYAQFVYKFIMIVNKGAFSFGSMKGPCIMRELIFYFISKSAMKCNMRLWRQMYYTIKKQHVDCWLDIPYHVAVY